MKPIVTESGIMRIVAFTAIALVLMIMFAPFTPSVVQKQNVAQAEAHCAILRQLTAQNPSYKHIEFLANTTEKIIILGYVASSNKLENLVSVVEKSHPPRLVSYNVRIEPLLFEETL